jgi:hypothetical protein
MGACPYTITVSPWRLRTDSTGACLQTLRRHTGLNGERDRKVTVSVK